jgi:DNA-binding protein
MNLLSILGKVGSSILADVIPGGNTILSVVNELLSSEDKLSVNATGAAIQSAIATMPANVQADLLSKEFDVEIIAIQEHTNVIAALGEVDKTGHSTRPFIALMMAWVVSFAIVGLVVMLGMAINKKDADTVIAMGNNWPLVMALLGIPSGLLRAYFGMRTKEKQQKYHAISNTTPKSVLTDLANLWKSS